MKEKIEKAMDAIYDSFESYKVEAYFEACNALGTNDAKKREAKLQFNVVSAFDALNPAEKCAVLSLQVSVLAGKPQEEIVENALSLCAPQEGEAADVDYEALAGELQALLINPAMFRKF